MTKKIIFTGGGTGGHIFPAINLMEHYLEKKYEVLLVTDARGRHFLKNNSKFKTYILKAGTPTNKNLFKKFYAYILILFSILKSINIIKREKPDMIFGFGGYVSFPICFASKFFNLPLVIYENNMVLGRANKYLSSITRKILLAKNVTKDFSENDKRKISQVGSILSKNIIYSKANEKEMNKEKFSLLVLGGSQGAEVFGKIVPMVVKMIKDTGQNIEINQQCVENQKSLITDFYKSNNIKNYVFDFDKNISRFFLISDLAITRCGASTTAELAHTYTPFIAVPLPNSIDNHQYLNAKYYKDKDCCWIIEQNDFNTENLFNLIMENIKNKNKLRNMHENMKKNFNKNVYKNIENEIKEFI
tara:strand:- start:142 stop:1221 length:1080 start_codon:yes stop_codon:yes gene_type:complete